MLLEFTLLVYLLINSSHFSVAIMYNLCDDHISLNYKNIDYIMKNIILKLEEFIVRLPQKVRELVSDFLEQFYIAIGKLKNLSQTNYNLGIFHMDKGNINDAKMRFIFVTKLAPELPLAHYHLARCYLFNLAFDKATQELKTALSLDKKLAAAKYRLDVVNKDIKLQSVPIQVLQEDYNNWAHTYEKYLETQQKYNAPEILSKAIAKYFSESEIETKSMLALDLGCGTGLVGAYLKQVVAIRSLVGVDISTNMLVLAKELEINNNPVYDQTQECDFNALKITKKRYDIITACMSFVYSSDLSSVLSQLDRVVSEDALLGVVFLKSPNSDVVFDYDNGCFAFSAKYLSKAFKKFKWHIINQEEIKLFSSGSVGLMFILSK